jgi:hypothetical protein
MKSTIQTPTRTLALAAALALAPFAIPSAWAGTVFGVDVGNYVVMYEGGGGNQLNVNNFGTPNSRFWNGDIGVAGTGRFNASGPGTLNGNVNFAAANTGQSTISNTTINGTVNFGVASVQSTMNNLNSLSSGFGALAGTAAPLTIDTSSGTQTVLASSGALLNGARVFSTTSVTSGNGQNLVIKSDGSTGVVIDVNTPGDAQFHGNILLQDLSGKFFGDAGYAGLSPDQLLINLYAGTALSGGDKLDANNNGDQAHPSNIIYGTFLDPNGAISFVNTRITGRIFGGDTTNMQIVSGDTINLPPGRVPEPQTFALALCGALAFVMSRSRRGSRGPASR